MWGWGGGGGGGAEEVGWGMGGSSDKNAHTLTVNIVVLPSIIPDTVSLSSFSVYSESSTPAPTINLLLTFLLAPLKVYI